MSLFPPLSGIDMISEGGRGQKKKTTWLNRREKLENPHSQNFLLR